MLMSTDPRRRPLRVNRCEKNEDPKEKMKRRVISFFFMAIVLFLWYYSTINIDTFISTHSPDLIYGNALSAVNMASVFIVYTYFIYEIIQPSRFNMKISIAVLAVLFAFLIFTITLLNY
jgi:hypothetical protein